MLAIFRSLTSTRNFGIRSISRWLIETLRSSLPLAIDLREAAGDARFEDRGDATDQDGDDGKRNQDPAGRTRHGGATPTREPAFPERPSMAVARL